MRKNDDVNSQLMRGLELRSGKSKQSIRIAFVFRGVICKETLRLDHTKQNILFASRMRGEILNSIEKGVFQYFDYFPDSKKARLFGRVPSKKTIGDLLDEQMELARKTLSPSTTRGYEQVYRSHLHTLADIQVAAFDRLALRQFIQSLPAKKKTITNILTPLRNAMAEALNDGLIDVNPFSQIVLDKLLTREQRRSEFVVHPFAIWEIHSIIQNCEYAQESNFWKFAFSSGMRTSELIALEWRDIDFEKGKIHVARRKVEGKTEEVLKTVAGKRVIDMRKASLEALQDQFKYTGKEGRHVFLDPRMDTPWGTDHILRMRFRRILTKANKIRMMENQELIVYRRPYQTRHTFCSMLLSAGVPGLYIARQMGHVGLEMIHKRYGRWVEQGSSPETQVSLDDFFSPISPQIRQKIA